MVSEDLVSILQHTPLYSGNNSLQLALIEIGCRPKGKPSQLKDKKQLFQDFWSELYPERQIPDLYRMVVHYDPESVEDLDRLTETDYQVDVAVCYNHISYDMLKGLDEEDYKLLFKKKNEFIHRAVVQKDSRRLHQIMMEDRKDDKSSNFRGRFAEIIAFKDIKKFLPQNMLFLTNGIINYANSRYFHGTEIDGILAFYNFQDYIHILNQLEQLPYCEVTRNFPQSI